MAGIADLASLLAWTVVKLYISGFLVEEISVFSGNSASLDTHYFFFVSMFLIRRYGIIINITNG
jgi:hypothetical protein